jgi:hypothetical protein
VRNLCTNDVDFCSLENINKISYNQFFSFKDDDNFIYGFDIKSIYNLYLKNNNIVSNPFTTKKIDKSIYNMMIYLIKYSNLLNINIVTSYDISSNITIFKTLEIKILTLFQNMDSLGNYTNMNWFNNLNKNQLIRFFHELLDIWNYRANLSYNVKREICPPHGNPFRYFNYSANNLQNYNFFSLKRGIVNVLEEFIYKGIDNDSKCLGCYYILSALTLVSNDAAESMPWLYESVYHTNNT